MSPRSLLLPLALLLAAPGRAQEADPQAPRPAPFPARFGAVAAGDALRLTADDAAPLGAFAPASGAVTIGTDASYHSLDVAVDAAGGLHAAFATWAHADATPTYYAYCPPTNLAACADLDAWTRVALPGTDEMTFVQLQLTPAGQPRLLLYTEDLEVAGFGATRYMYAACDGGCTGPAGWAVGELWETENGGAFFGTDFDPHAFRLDAQGRPRFVYQQDDGEAYFASCNANCTAPAAWTRTRMPAVSADDYERSTLMLTADGSPRVLTTTEDEEWNEYLAYLACDGACDDPGDWTVSEPILQMTEGGACGNGWSECSWSAALDPLGRPRIAIQPEGQPVIYAWCDAGCEAAANWFGYLLADEPGTAVEPTLALDAAGSPRMVYQTGSGAGLGYAWCEADCETDEVCCDIYREPVCLKAEKCPQACERSSDCDTASGEVCCTTLKSRDKTLAADGLCIDPQMTTCPSACERSSDCNTKKGQICCNGLCAETCEQGCQASSECDGQVCCRTAAAKSPWVNDLEEPGYDVPAGNSGTSNGGISGGPSGGGGGGGGGGAAGGRSGAGGTSGAGSCETCSQAIAGGDFVGFNVCPGDSAQRLNALKACACVDGCAAACAAFCTSGVRDSACDLCIGTSCSASYGACLQDGGGD